MREREGGYIEKERNREQERERVRGRAKEKERRLSSGRKTDSQKWTICKELLLLRRKGSDEIIL